MTAGAYISGAGHLLVILWILLGGVLFRAQAPEIMSSADVTLMTEAEFEALNKPLPPDVVDEIAQPKVPQLSGTPEVSTAADALDEIAPAPQITPPSEAESVPEVPGPATAVAEVEVADPDQPVAPPAEVMAALVPPTPDAGTPKPMARVAPMPRPEAPPKAVVAPDPVPAIVPEAVRDAEPRPVEPRAAAAPEAATSEAATETDTPKQAAPITAMRPPMRPKAPPKPAPKPEPKPEPKLAAKPDPRPDDTQDAIAAAMLEATAEPAEPAAQPAAQLGGQLSGNELSGVRETLELNWNTARIDGSVASQVLVVLAFSVAPNGVPDRSTIRTVRVEGGDETARRIAVETAEDAIHKIAVRGGFSLPRDKYSLWQNMEIVFGPRGELGF